MKPVARLSRLRRGAAAAPGRFRRSRPRGRGLSTSRAPRVRDGLVVLEPTERGCRALCIDATEGRFLAFARDACEPSPDSLRSLVARLACPYRAAVVVTPEARPEVLWVPRERVLEPTTATARDGSVARGWVVDDDGADEVRCLSTALPAERRAFWQETLAAAGIVLEGVYPLAGTTVAGTAPDGARPRLVLQVEERWSAVVETLGSSLLSVEIDESPPSPRRCARLLGEGCPDVSLCGQGADLSEFGFALVMSTGTWVRVAAPPACARAMPGSFAPLVGAALHACGLVAPDAIACVPPREERGAHVTSE